MSIKLLICCLLFVLINTFSLLAQESNLNDKGAKYDLSLEGMFGFSVGNDFYAINVGGPSLFLVLNQNWKIGVGALPSIYVLNGKTGARLGVSPRVDYKNLVFTAPFFHRDTTGEWIWSIGGGYKFHKKN
ncbi:MAG TPA: hypothetical protein PKC24_02640 [Cyclobacteriaceae bacterium]|nr:hypothetical protein [Cyclobacteriaceae bacterium]